ncbi:hypothetical protein [Streptomyces sp. NPDC101455]|uniref:hypothetical protein n=1 Tax=Streptomyces sp. NPDC101455 TaxID=3366142 RepID=UPI00380B1C2A
MLIAGHSWTEAMPIGVQRSPAAAPTGIAALREAMVSGVRDADVGVVGGLRATPETTLHVAHRATAWTSTANSSWSRTRAAGTE